MRTRYLLAAIAAGLASASATAQTATTTGTTSTGTTSGSNITGLNGSSTGASNFQIQQQQAAPQITGGGTTGANVQASNAFAGYLANPQYQGRAGSTGTDNPGGFGTPLSGTSTSGSRSTAGTAFSAGTSRSTSTTGTTYGSTSSTTGRTGTTMSSTGLNSASSLANTAGRTGTTNLGTSAFGSRTTAGNSFGSSSLSGQSNNTIVALPRQISYTATMRMPIPVVQAQPMHTELRGVLDRSSMIANPKGIEILTNGPVVVLRGKVKDKDEAETAEGVIRLTPGVKEVQNELKY